MMVSRMVVSLLWVVSKCAEASEVARSSLMSICHAHSISCDVLNGKKWQKKKQ